MVVMKKNLCRLLLCGLLWVGAGKNVNAFVGGSRKISKCCGWKWDKITFISLRPAQVIIVLFKYVLTYRAAPSSGPNFSQ